MVNNNNGMTPEEAASYAEASAHAQSITSSFKQAVELQGKMNKSLKGYIEGLNRIKDIDKDILDYQKIQKKLILEIDNSDGDRRKALSEQKKQLDRLINSLNIQKKILKENLDTVNKTKIIGLEMLKGFSKLPDLIQRGYGKIQSSGLFDMDKAIKTSALSMGLLGQESNAFRGSMKGASMDAAMLGTSFEELVKIQADYADELGRNVDLGKSGALAINEMAKGTSMGLEGATKMSAEFENIGMSAENTRDFIQQTMNDASSMGLNASKVIKNIQNNIKMLNKYNFKNGVKGLEQMALSVSKLGVDMDTIAPMADKLWNIEGAVEMSAQLQVMGGAFASLADPFKLMYKARNDMKGLTEDFANAAKQSMVFGKDGIEMNTLEMSRLKKIAEETGVEYDKLVTMGRNAFKNDAIKKQSSGLDDKQIEYISNLAKFSENGTATIEINGAPKLVSMLSAADKIMLSQRVIQQADLKKRAEAAMTFDDTFKGFINALKVNLLPIVEEMDKKMVPALKNFVDKFIAGGWDKKLGDLAKWVGGIVSSIGKFILEQPVWLTGLELVGAKITGWFIDYAVWVKNGWALAEGFNMGTVGGGGKSFIGKLMNKLTGNGGTAAATTAGAEGAGLSATAPIVGETIGMSFAAIATTAVASLAAGFIGKIAGDKIFESTTGKKSNSGGKWGGGIGGLIGAGIGTLILPGVGTAIGAGLGAGVGSYFGNLAGQNNVENVNDGVIQFNQNDKFMKVNDSTMVAGTNVNGNKDLANALNGGGIKSPSQSSTISNNLNVNLSELKISGMIELKLGNNVSKEIGDSLINDPVFVRNISKMINIEIAKVRNIKIT